MSEIITKDGRVFTLIGEEPYQRKDGAMTALKVWQCPCAVCGTPFEIKTPLSTIVLGDTKAFGMKHCAAHKLTQEEASAIWAASIKAGRQRKKDARA